MGAGPISELRNDSLKTREGLPPAMDSVETAKPIVALVSLAALQPLTHPYPLSTFPHRICLPRWTTDALHDVSTKRGDDVTWKCWWMGRLTSGGGRIRVEGSVTEYPGRRGLGNETTGVFCLFFLSRGPDMSPPRSTCLPHAGVPIICHRQRPTFKAEGEMYVRQTPPSKFSVTCRAWASLLLLPLTASHPSAIGSSYIIHLVPDGTGIKITQTSPKAS